ncbi:muts domain V-domain-containing protein [Choanephora cucurbitarum]|nr:muts domain V-domain-containing protein [Choanephora cucurbitarum]
MVDDLIRNDASNSQAVGGGHLMCLIEQKRGGHGPDERVLIGMIAVQTSTGDIVYDTFEDTYMRTELETRLLHIEPNEILIPTLISQPTERLIQHLSLQTSYESVRIERISLNDNLSTDYNAALTFVSDFYATTAYLSHIVELPDNVIKALACLLRYLQEFNLSNILTSAKFFSHFVSQSHMLLSGNTLVNLEVYRNNTDFTEKGSLFSILNHTQTKFGHRLLRKWVGRPLVDKNQLNQRTSAIEELLKTTNRKKGILLSVLRQLPDLEKGLCRIHYGKSMPLELIQVLDGFIKVSSSFHESHDVFESSLLNQLFSPFSTIRQAILDFRSSVQPTKDKIDYFVSEEQWPDIPREKKNIQHVECLLQQHLEELKEATGLGKDLAFVTLAGIEYLLEVSNTKTKRIPQTWIKVSGTKAVSRYHDKYIIEQLKKRERHRELLNMSVERAYKGFLAAIAEKYEELRDVVSCLAQLDCLLSLSITASQLNYTKPLFVDTDQPYMDVIQARHPIIEQLNATSTYVPNDIQLANPHKVMILTGPNMGGKSSYIRQIALIAMMAQIGSYVPAKKATLGILDAIYTRMGASDNMMRGKSTFMVELHETSDMMRQATSRSLVILDELGRGTSTHDGQAIAYAVLKHFIEHVQCITLFVTHYPSLGQITHVFPNQVRNYFMSYLQEEAMDGSGIANIVFLYKLMEGVATSSYGMNVARLADIPISIIKAAKEKSDRFEKEMRHVELKQQKLRLLQSVMHETRLSLDNKQRLKSLQ